MEKKKKVDKTLILFFILAFTWALPTTFLGALAALVLVIAGKRPKRFGPCWYFPTKQNYGLELGLFFIAPERGSYKLKCHEVGHQLQACFLFGPLTPFIAFIPSAVRFWLREQKTQKAKRIYSSIVCGLPFILFIMMIVLGSLFSILPLVIIGAFMSVYCLILSAWLFFVEIPQYEVIPYPTYDDFIIEFDASNRGLEFIGKHFPDEITKIKIW